MGQSSLALWLLQKTCGSKDPRRSEEDVEEAQDLAPEVAQEDVEEAQEATPEVAQEKMAQRLAAPRMNHRVEHLGKSMGEEELKGPTKQLAEMQPHPCQWTGMKMEEEKEEEGESDVFSCQLAPVDASEFQVGVQEEEELEA